MKYNKDYSSGIGVSKISAQAYKTSNVWRLGVHFFKAGKSLIFRVCFWRNKKHTYYWQAFKTRKKR